MCYSLWQPINSTTSLAGNNANFNGNISAYEWTYKGALNYYWFHYDNLNRLEVATNAGLDAGTYKGERVAYDTMGNILGLTQYRDNENPDALEFFYNGNQIKNTYDASGRKLAMIYKTINYQLPQPLNPGQIISESYDEDAMVEGIAYIDNVEYSSYSSGFVNNQRIYEYQIDKIHSSEGYISGYSLSNTSLYHNYYRRDHLGNNREVWLGSYTRDGHTYPSTTVQRTQYYPSGLPWESAESDYSDTQHRKYNGKELVEMHGLDEYDSEARWFYPAIMRTTTIDPLAEKYYSTSPYAWCGNNPVNTVDLRGDSITTIVNTTIKNPDGTTSLQSTQYYYGQNSNGTYGFIDSSGNLYSGTDAFVSSLTTALNDLRTGGNVGSSLVSDLVSSTKNVQIAQGKNTADPNGTYIKWNPNSTTGGMSQIGTENRPSYIGLGHEMAHIQDAWKGTIDNNTWVTVGGTVIPNAEKYATHIENQLRAENNISLRTHYGIDASSRKRVGLESTRIINGNLSLFYNQSNGKSPMGIPLLSTPFFYRKR